MRQAQSVHCSQDGPVPPAAVGRQKEGFGWKVSQWVIYNQSSVLVATYPPHSTAELAKLHSCCGGHGALVLEAVNISVPATLISCCAIQGRSFFEPQRPGPQCGILPYLYSLGKTAPELLHEMSLSRKRLCSAFKRPGGCSSVPAPPSQRSHRRLGSDAGFLWG